MHLWFCLSLCSIIIDNDSIAYTQRKTQRTIQLFLIRNKGVGWLLDERKAINLLRTAE
jgi:hypothetical protein